MNKNKLFNIGAWMVGVTLAISPALEAFGMILLGLLAVGAVLILIGLFPEITEAPPATNYPAGSSLGGEELYNEIAESGAMSGLPNYGRIGDDVTGYSWTGHDKDGNYAEYITWFNGKNQWIQKVK